MMRRSSLMRGMAVMMALIVTMGVSLQAQQTPNPTGRALAQQLPPVCAPASTQPYLYYNATAGQWYCTATLKVTKTVSNILQNTFTTMLTVTVPNAGVSADIRVRVFATLGAGGTLGAYSCSAAFMGQVVVARTAAKLAVVSASTAAETANACVAGAETITLSYQASSVSGGTAGTDTFTIQVKVVGSGLSTNHRATVEAELTNNANATAVSMQ